MTHVRQRRRAKEERKTEKKPCSLLEWRRRSGGCSCWLEAMNWSPSRLCNVLRQKNEDKNSKKTDKSQANHSSTADKKKRCVGEEMARKRSRKRHELESKRATETFGKEKNSAAALRKMNESPMKKMPQTEGCRRDVTRRQRNSSDTGKQATSMSRESGQMKGESEFLVENEKTKHEGKV
uniref:Uncharacterized protein n=1 Tax=Toxoplasma gondii TgCATBr9 TaxID=943120 RepID=A0A2T6ILT1_TOXGO|nr:hypothetical protein TGBR9_383700 [Toxoplasma gondii TgCATBr9]